MKKSAKCDERILFIPISAQPPTFGTVLSIMSVYDQFDKIIICLQDNPILIKTDVLIKMFAMVFRPPKFEITTRDEDFAAITHLPYDLPIYDELAVLTDTTYINLISKGIRCTLLARSLGFDEFFHRVAFKKSMELEALRMRMTLINVNKMSNIEETSEEPTDEESEE